MAAPPWPLFVRQLFLGFRQILGRLSRWLCYGGALLISFPFQLKSEISASAFSQT